MPYLLTYSYSLVQTDRFGNPIGSAYGFAGSQFSATNTPSSADLTALSTAMGADVSAKLVAAMPAELVNDSDNAGSGGAG